jgi:hypothetical protein
VKAQSKRDLDHSGRKGREELYVKGDDWRNPEFKGEGRGWAKMDSSWIASWIASRKWRLTLRGSGTDHAATLNHTHFVRHTVAAFSKSGCSVQAIEPNSKTNT